MPKKSSGTQKKSFPRIVISAKNIEQKNMLKTIHNNTVTFVKGSPGSGKTYIAVGVGLQALLKKDCEQLIFTRPVVEAGGEKLGFLPGTMYEKIDPYMIPIFETLHKLVPPELLKDLMPKNNENGNSSPIRVLPLAYMRGSTFSNSFIIADEMQNSTPEQMRMILTRLGEGSTMVLCGDVHQTDIQFTNGMFDAFEKLQEIKDVGFVTMTQDAIVRHPVMREIENRYLNFNKCKNQKIV